MVTIYYHCILFLLQFYGNIGPFPKLQKKKSWAWLAFYHIYILGVVALHESNISSCLHFSMQNIEMPSDLDRASRWSNINVSQ